VTLWKDVPGLLTADPRVVPDARVIPQLHMREAAELAYYGAKVLHSRALIPVAGQAHPVYVRPFAEPSAPGTEISSQQSSDRHPVKALSAVSAQALVTVAGRGLLGVPGVAARTFATLSAHGMSVSLITQASSEQSICFTVPEKEAKAAKEHLDRAFHDEIARRDVDGIQVQTGMTTIAVVGLGMAGHAWHRGARVLSLGLAGNQRGSNRAGLIRAEHLAGGGLGPGGPGTKVHTQRLPPVAPAVAHAAKKKARPLRSRA